MKVSFNYKGGFLKHHENIPELIAPLLFQVNSSYKSGIAVAVMGEIQYIYEPAVITLKVRPNGQKLVSIQTETEDI